MDYKQSKFISKWKKEVKKAIRLASPDMGDKEIDKKLNKLIEKNLCDPQVQIYNNYIEKKVDLSLLEVTEFIYKNEPIMCASGVMFKRHDQAFSPLNKMTSDFLKKRKMYKGIMYKHLGEANKIGETMKVMSNKAITEEYKRQKEEYDKQLYLFTKYDRAQLLEKVKANSIYGASGLKSAVFYNLHTATSTTMTGQVLISMAGMAFEAFLANNVLFYGMNECMEFINNVVTEKRDYSDSIYITNNVSVKDVKKKLIDTFYDKSTIRDDIIDVVLRNLDQEDLNRLYYKNNIYEFLRNKPLKKMLKESLCSVDDFKDPNEIPEIIKPSLNKIYDLLKEYVLYNYEIYDRIDRLKHHKRKVVITIDTDSNFVNLDKWYRFVTEEVLEIKEIAIYDSAVKYVEDMDYMEKYEDYEYTIDDLDKIQEAKEYIDANKPKILTDRYKILNYGCSIITFMIADVIARYAKNTNIKDPEKAALLTMKNEYLFDRILLTTSKKNYASIVLLKEGVEVPDAKKLDLKGLDIAKSTSSRDTQKKLQNILENFILRRGNINITIVLKEMQKLENEIYEELMRGSTKFLKPEKVSEFQTYDKPMSRPGVRGTMVWNTLYPMNTIDLPNRVLIAKMKPNSIEEIEELKYSEPEIFETLKDEIFNSELKELAKSGMSIIAIPQDMEYIPEWMIPYLDTDTIISDVTSKFKKILYSLGTKQISTRADSIHYSSILSF